MKMLSVLCCLTLWCCMCMAQTGEKNFIDQNYVEVTGTVEKEIVPDEIYLKIVISEKDKGKKTVEQQEKAMVRILENLGIDVRKDLSIADVSSNFKSYFLKRTAIQTSKNYQLLLHGTQKQGNLLVALEGAGISNISIDRVDHSRLEELRREVKVEAVKAAREKARAYAEALGQQIGKALYINEYNEGFGGRPAMYSNVRVRGMGMMADKAESMPEIDFEKIPLKASILVRFELK